MLESEGPGEAAGPGPAAAAVRVHGAGGAAAPGSRPVRSRTGPVPGAPRLRVWAEGLRTVSAA